MREILKLNRSYELFHKNGNKKSFTIRKCVGMGASCIVYDAVYYDDCDDIISPPHLVRLKECFPIDGAKHERDEAGSICWSSEESKKEALDNFVNAYRRQLELQLMFDDETGKINDSIYWANGTAYLSLDCEQGDTFNIYILKKKHEENALHDILKVMQALSEAVEKYHEAGYLHLDIKPENFLVKKNGTVKFIDFDSLILKEDLVNGEIKQLFSSNDWAAPEVKQGRFKGISEAADIYSIGMILFYAIFGHPMNIQDKLDFGNYTYEGNELFKRVHPGLQFEMSEFFRNTLNAAVKGRYQSMSDVIVSLKRMVRLADPQIMYLCSNVPQQINFFAGREQMLEEIRESLLNNKTVIVHGMGGIGKSELVKKFATDYADNFHTVVYLPCQNGVEDALKDESYVHIANISENTITSVNHKLALLKEKNLTDEKTLFILDDIRDLGDKSLINLMQLNCRFLITTRLQTKGIFDGAVTFELKHMNEDVLMEIFLHYYELAVSVEEVAKIKVILSEISYYTLLVPIIAKQMQNENMLPSQWLAKWSNSRKISAEERISHVKDDEFVEATPYGHLARIFDMASLSENDKKVLSVMSLIDKVYIDKVTLADLCGVKLEVLNHMIRMGWLLYDALLGRVGIHQAISTVIRTELKPDMKACAPFGDKIQNYPYLVKACIESLDWNKKSNAEFIMRRVAKTLDFNIMARINPILKRIVENSDFYSILDGEEKISYLVLWNMSKMDGAIYEAGKNNTEPDNRLAKNITEVIQLAKDVKHFSIYNNKYDCYMKVACLEKISSWFGDSVENLEAFRNNYPKTIACIKNICEDIIKNVKDKAIYQQAEDVLHILTTDVEVLEEEIDDAFLDDEWEEMLEEIKKEQSLSKAFKSYRGKINAALKQKNKLWKFLQDMLLETEIKLEEKLDLYTMVLEKAECIEVKEDNRMYISGSHMFTTDNEETDIMRFIRLTNKLLLEGYWRRKNPHSRLRVNILVMEMALQRKDYLLFIQVWDKFIKDLVDNSLHKFPYIEVFEAGNMLGSFDLPVFEVWLYLLFMEQVKVVGISGEDEKLLNLNGLVLVRTKMRLEALGMEDILLELKREEKYETTYANKNKFVKASPVKRYKLLKKVQEYIDEVLNLKCSDDLKRLTESLEADNLLDEGSRNLFMALTGDYSSTFYHFQLNGNLIPEYLVGNVRILDVKKKRYATKRNLIEKIECLAEIYFQQLLLNENKESKQTLEKYLALLEKVVSSEYRLLAWIVYGQLPDLLFQMKKYKEALKIYEAMEKVFESDIREKLSINELAFTMEYFSGMYKNLLSIKEELSLNKKTTDASLLLFRAGYSRLKNEIEKVTEYAIEHYYNFLLSEKCSIPFITIKVNGIYDDKAEWITMILMNAGKL